MRSELQAFQSEFAAAVLSGGASPHDRHRAFSVYRNTSLLRAVEALSDAFPTVRQLLGSEEFRRLALAYVRSEPPTNPVLAYYGGGFAAFLARAPKFAHSLYVVDCARIDCAFLEAHLAEDAGAARLSPSEIAPEQWGSVVALLHPATRFRWFSNATPTLWLSLRAGETRRAAPDTRSEGILITRPSGAVQAIPIQRAQYDLLASLVKGETVAAAASEAARRYSETTIADAFASLLSRGAVYGFKLKEGGRLFEGD